ncbi:uncharacterized protein LOC129309571 isoform X2 [Prosopis cineraria]|uniref:uncharacterized protein LOC129309571 isoform X2 n=1 Tax=Prosopis cineraria TaxID=364024 RepID=UPI0024108D1D|nr:uncharacterized protein LOC129309571 isoform X2 [Prosopis cineraria]
MLRLFIYVFVLSMYHLDTALCSKLLISSFSFLIANIYIYIYTPLSDMHHVLCADHGPCVSGAHNAVVTARAGKDLVSSPVSVVNNELLNQVCLQLVLDLVVPLMMLLVTSRMLLTSLCYNSNMGTMLCLVRILHLTNLLKVRRRASMCQE